MRIEMTWEELCFLWDQVDFKAPFACRENVRRKLLLLFEEVAGTDESRKLEVQRMRPRYISKKDEWFDEGTEAKYLYSMGENGGLFQGIKDGKRDEEGCGFHEFEINED